MQTENMGILMGSCQTYSHHRSTSCHYSIKERGRDETQKCTRDQEEARQTPYNLPQGTETRTVVYACFESKAIQNSVLWFWCKYQCFASTGHLASQVACPSLCRAGRYMVNSSKSKIFFPVNIWTHKPWSSGNRITILRWKLPEGLRHYPLYSHSLLETFRSRRNNSIWLGSVYVFFSGTGQIFISA